MGLIGKVLGYLWRLSRGGWLGDQVGARIGSGGARLFTFLWLIFLIVAIVLVLAGFDLEAVDRWLDAHSSRFELVGDVLFRIFYGFVILLCGLTVYTLGEEMLFPTGRKARRPTPMARSRMTASAMSCAAASPSSWRWRSAMSRGWE